MVRDGKHLRFGLRDAYLGFQAAENPQGAIIPLDALFGVESHGQPGFRAHGVVKTFAHDTDDGEGFAVDLHDLAKNVGIRGVAALPEAVTKNQFLISAGLALFRKKIAAEVWLDAEH